jgi:DNA-binding MarR family transcriptional regulator
MESQDRPPGAGPRDEAPQALINDIASMLGRQLAVYTAIWQAMIAEKLSLPITDVKALDLVSEFDALPTGQLAMLMGISSGGTTAMINRLETAGLLRRGRHPLDRRIIVIRPTTHATEMLARERRLIAQQVAMLAQRYEKNDIRNTHEFLVQCVRALREDTLAWLDQGHGIGNRS